MGHISKSNLIAVLTRFLAKLRGEVVDNLESTATNKPLSAKQGKLLGQRMSDAESDIDTLEGRVATLSGGEDFKGKVETLANLPAASGTNKKHKYWVKAENAYYESNGSEWVDLTGSYSVYDGLDSDSTTNALSAAKGKELNNKFGGVDFRNVENYNGPVDLKIGPGTDGIKDHVFMDILENENGGEGHMVDIIPNEEEEADVLLLVPESAKPTSSSSAGHKGWVYEDSDYLYVCVATNTWKRVALSTF